MGTAPQQTSRVLVLARTNCTREGAGGFSVSKNHKSLKHTWLFHAFLYPSLPLQMYNRV